jgi:hypothetical protein
VKGAYAWRRIGLLATTKVGYNDAMLDGAKPWETPKTWPTHHGRAVAVVHCAHCLAGAIIIGRWVQCLDDVVNVRVVVDVLQHSGKKNKQGSGQAANIWCGLGAECMLIT